MENFSVLMTIIAPLIVIGVLYVYSTASNEFVNGPKGRLFAGLGVIFLIMLMVLVIIADGGPQ